MVTQDTSNGHLSKKPETSWHNTVYLKKCVLKY